MSSNPLTVRITGSLQTKSTITLWSTKTGLKSTSDEEKQQFAAESYRVVYRCHTSYQWIRAITGIRDKVGGETTETHSHISILFELRAAIAKWKAAILIRAHSLAWRVKSQKAGQLSHLYTIHERQEAIKINERVVLEEQSKDPCSHHYTITCMKAALSVNNLCFAYKSSTSPQNLQELIRN